jgi:hypothetical protein
MFAFVYAPGVTAVFARDIVPEEVIGPPDNPVPVATDVTVPAFTVPFDAEVILPKASTVKLVFV